jgi:RNA polymerase sigma-70 factor (ECF subfamily)
MLSAATEPVILADETLARAREGCPSAFASLVREHQAMVYGLAYHFLHDRGRAEELAQDVFLALHQNLARLESADHMTFWLRRVTSNRCIDSIRRLWRRFEFAVDRLPERADGPVHGDPFLGGLLQKLVAELPPHPRMVVTLRYQEDLEPVEIAKMLDMPVNTVKSHLRRSMESLRKRLAALGYANES